MEHFPNGDKQPKIVGKQLAGGNLGVELTSELDLGGDAPFAPFAPLNFMTGLYAMRECFLLFKCMTSLYSPSIELRH